MPKLDERKPEELRAWIEESDIARELLAHLHALKAAQLGGMVSALRANDVTRGSRHAGAYDEFDRLISILERQPEKKLPSDWDGCWDPHGVDPKLLDPAFLDLGPTGRQVVKTKYLADLFPSSVREAGKNLAFLDYFQVDKLSGTQKGIVLLNLGTWQQ